MYVSSETHENSLGTEGTIKVRASTQEATRPDQGLCHSDTESVSALVASALTQSRTFSQRHTEFSGEYSWGSNRLTTPSASL